MTVLYHKSSEHYSLLMQIPPLSLTLARPPPSHRVGPRHFNNGHLCDYFKASAARRKRGFLIASCPCVCGITRCELLQESSLLSKIKVKWVIYHLNLCLADLSEHHNDLWLELEKSTMHVS